MSEGETLKRESISATQHFTEPPPRFSEAALVKRMEELGIGRPSTYASILAVLKDRGYTRLDKKRIIPEDKGRIVVAFLESFFQKYVEYDFTASLEEQLDRVSNNELVWQDLLRDFWEGFTAAVGEIKDLRITQVLDALNDLLGAAYLPAARRRRRRRGNARPAAKDNCRSRSAASAPLSAARAIRNAASRASSPPARMAQGSGGARVLGKDPETGSRRERAQRPLRSVSAARRSRGQGREAETREPAERRLARRRRSCRRRSACSRCRAKSESIRKTASRSSPASAASAPTCSTERSTPISKTATRCSISGSIARSR